MSPMLDGSGQRRSTVDTPDISYPSETAVTKVALPMQTRVKTRCTVQIKVPTSVVRD